MRGKVYGGPQLGAGHRITPAYAGKSLILLGITFSAKDHPRVCGEKSMSAVQTLDRMGSPPRMRGKVNGSPQLVAGDRITPAYAGKRVRGVVKRIARGDHPRVCGEKLVDLGEGTGLQGSPPRMRGKDQALKYAVKGARITPAYAGKSFSLSREKGLVWDHPRVCGEKGSFLS